eukprot:gene23707-29953_t
MVKTTYFDDLAAESGEEDDRDIFKSSNRRTNMNDEDNDSDMDGFIDHGDDEGDVSDEENSRELQRHQKSLHNTQRRAGKRDGPTYDQIQEAMDIFGAGYGDFDDEEEDEPDEDDNGESDEREDDDQNAALAGDADNTATEVTYKLSARDKKLIGKLRSRYERSQLVASFCTDKDEEIRRIDRPERFQHVMRGRGTPDDEERRNESEWMALKLAESMFSDASLLKSNRLPSAAHILQTELVDPIEYVLKAFQLEQQEVPFVWAYRRDYLHPLMTRAHLWQLYALDQQWEALYVMKLRLKQVVQALCDAAEGTLEEDERARQKANLDIANHTKFYNSLLQELIDAEQREKDCMDVIDESEEHSAEDRENVRLATENLEALRLQLEPAHAELQQFKEAAETVNQRILRKGQYNPSAAKEVVRLFPANRYVPIIDASLEEAELRDIFRFLSLLMQGAERGSRESAAQDDADADQLATQGEEEDGGQQRGSDGYVKQNRRLGIVKRDEYGRLKGIRSLRKFAEKIALPVHEFGDSLRHGFRADPPSTESRDCEEEASLHTDHKVLLTGQMVIKAATVLIATELSLEPSVRREARRFLKEECTVSSTPTEKGLSVITPFHEYFGLHMLDRKPLREMHVGGDRTLFIRLVEAEKIGLITLTIDPPRKQDTSEPDLSKLFLILMPLFLPLKAAADPNRQTWDAVRLHILQVCLEKHLLPSLQLEFRRDLLRVGRETIVEESASSFERMLQVGPHRVPNPDSREYVKDLLRSCPGRPNYSTVAAICQSSSGNEPLFMAFVNKDGVLRSHDLLPVQAASQKMDRIKQFIVANKPDLIVLNASGGYSSRTLSMHIEKNILREVGELLETQHKQQMEQREANGYAHRDEDEDEFVPYKAQVMILKDDVANIFKGSTRAKAMFPELQPGGAAAVSLARFAQEPLSEYCGIWTSANAIEQFGFEALFLNTHPLKALLRGAQGSLLHAMETKLVDAVCDVGVDINKAVTFDHLAPMLAFVGGLGLRKADALRQNIRRTLGVVESRNSLLVKKLLGRVVWMNSAGFLRVCDIGQDKQIDPLDNTRIHPECYVTYDFAPKICADALEVDNNPGDYLDIVERLMKSVRRELEKRMKRHPKWVDLWEGGQRPVQGVTPFTDKIKTADGAEHLLTIELHDSLSQLLLDDYSVDLENQGRGKRRLQLDHIKDELRFPWLDLRASIQAISTDDSFAILTGESDSSLYVGLKLGCTVTEISDSSFYDEKSGLHKRRQRAVVKTDSGLRGFISLYDVSDDHIDVESANLADYVQSGMRILAVVISVKKDKLFVDLSIKPSFLSRSEAVWLENRETDRHAREWWENTVHKNPSKLFDPHFKIREALEKFTLAENSLISSAEAVNSQMSGVNIGGSSARSHSSSSTAGTNRMQMRMVHHPLFANMDYRDTEDKLRREGKGAGEVLIRPSSKGADYLTITWAFQENWFKHISVQEKGKRAGDLGLGSQLVVMESDMADEPFSDLDEMFSRYIEPMNDLVAVMVSHRNFLSGSVEEVEVRMREQLLELPNRIPYFIRFEPTRPGAFVLTWLSLNSRSEVPVKKELIEVRPYGYKIRTETFARPSDLIGWFKKTTEAAAAASVSAAQKSSFAQRQQKSAPSYAATGHQNTAYFPNNGSSVAHVEPARRQSRFNQLPTAYPPGQHYGQR